MEVLEYRLAEVAAWVLECQVTIKNFQKKRHANKRDKSKEHRGSSEESNISGIWKSITHSLGGGVESGHTDHKTSLGTGEISTNLDDGISFDVTGRKHDHRYNEHESHKEHHNNDNGLTEYKSSAKTNWTANEHLGKNKNSYWNEGEIIVIPISDEEKSKGVIDRKSQNSNSKMHLTKRNTPNNGEKDDVNIDGIIIPFGDSEESSEISSSGNKHNDGSKDHNNHDEKKEGNGNKHIGREESYITISHGNGDQSSGDDKRHNNENGNSSNHIKEGSRIVTSHAGHKDGHNKSKEHQKLSKGDKIKNGAEKGEHSSNHTGRGESITISRSKDRHSSNGNDNSHVKGEGDIVIPHGSHKETKESSKETETKKKWKKERDSSHHKGGRSDGHIGSENNDVKEENTNRSNEKGIIVTINGSHGKENQSKNSTGHGGVIAVSENVAVTVNQYYSSFKRLFTASMTSSISC